VLAATLGLAVPAAVATVVDPASARLAIASPAVTAQHAELVSLAATGRATDLAARLERIAHDATLDATSREWLLEAGLHALASIAPTPAARGTVTRLTARRPVVFARVDPDHGERTTPLYDTGATAGFVLRAWDRNAARAAAAADLAAGSSLLALRYEAQGAAAREGLVEAFRSAHVSQLAVQRAAFLVAITAGRRVDEPVLVLAERLADPELFARVLDGADEPVALAAIPAAARTLDAQTGSRGARACEPPRRHRLGGRARDRPLGRQRRCGSAIPVRCLGRARCGAVRSGGAREARGPRSKRRARASARGRAGRILAAPLRTRAPARCRRCGARRARALRKDRRRFAAAAERGPPVARTLSRAIGTALLCAIALPAAAECIFDVGGEITNPFAPGCGDVIFTYTENDNAGTNIALGYPPPVPVASMTPVTGFRDYDSLFARHQSLLTLNDEVAGEVVGQTLAGRDIWVYVIGDADAATAEGFAEGAVLVNGGIHAREWQTPEAVTAVFEALVAGKADGGFFQYLVENLTTVLVPVNNVDGFIQTQLYPVNATADRQQPREGRMRRKNLRSPQTGGFIDSDIETVADNFWGVDLNRNSAQGFGQQGGSSSSVTSLIYRGAVPHSEPENLALQQAATLGPASRLRLFSDTHSFGQIYFAPRPGNARLDAITQSLAQRMIAASGRNYTYGPDPVDSPGIGTTADHFAFGFAVPAWTLEVEPMNGGQDYGGLASHGHSGFILPALEAPRMRDDVLRQYLLGFYRQSGPPAAIAAEIRENGSGAIVYRAHWETAGATTRALTVDVDEALVPGGSYRLWVAFNKPMRIRNSAGNIVSYAGQNRGAAVGAVALEIPSLTGQDLSLGADAAWLGAPGGAPDGYLRYSDDAFAVDFTLPDTIDVTAATAVVLRLDQQDLAQMALDAEPATAVDWGGGHWLRLENAEGLEGDSGGANCSFRPFIAPEANAAPPATAAGCRAIVEPPPPPPDRDGGGGEGLGLLFVLLGLLPFVPLRRG
jgi:Zinc carboxypeptidase